MKISPFILLGALVALVFTLATKLVDQMDTWMKREQSNSISAMILGDGRKLMASQFFTMADVYFHNGNYPSIFELNAPKHEDCLSPEQGHDHDDHDVKENAESEKELDIKNQPKDWVDAFGRNFRITEQTHLAQYNEREMLPWLRLAADLDPQKTETYTVAAFFLWKHLNRPDQAEEFLREGLRNNLDSYDILFELGQLYYHSSHDIIRARNVWELAVKKYYLAPPTDELVSRRTLDKLAINLAQLESEAGNYDKSKDWLHIALKVSTFPVEIQKKIDDLQAKKLAPPPSRVQGTD